MEASDAYDEDDEEAVAGSTLAAAVAAGSCLRHIGRRHARDATEQSLSRTTQSTPPTVDDGGGDDDAADCKASEAHVALLRCPILVLDVVVVVVVVVLFSPLPRGRRRPAGAAGAAVP